MANALYHSFNFSRSGSPEAKIPADKLNDSIVSHVMVKTGFVYYKTLFKHLNQVNILCEDQRGFKLSQLQRGDAGFCTTNKIHTIFLDFAKAFDKGLHRYWCRLYRETDTYPRQLVLYEILKNKKQVSQLIPLDTVFKIFLDNDKHQFDILTPSKKYSIRTATLQEATIWVETINQEVFGPPLPGIIYRFRVKSDRSYKYKGPIANYLLKVYDNKIQLYSSNGKIPTDFSCDLKDIHRIKYLSTMQHKSAINEYLSITIKNAQSNFIEKDVLVLQVKSPGDLSKVINHRKKLMADKLLPKIGPDQVTSAKTPLAIQPEISFNESTSLATEHENTYDKLNTLKPYANVQLGELHRDFAKLFSNGDNMSKMMTLPQKKHSTSATFSPENEPSPSENQTKASRSKSLQNISDNDQFLNINRETSPSDLDAPARASSQDNFLQVPAMATNAVMTETSLARPKSTSFVDTRNEVIYDNVYELVSPIYYTLPSGFDFYNVYHDDVDDDDDDDHYYVIDHIDRYLEILPAAGCDEHLYERITADATDDEINDDGYVYDYVRR